tara:strand:- start:923 stop:3037 length:2115 start_codon:yes stop_codon:yes gene_type:complete
MNNPLNRSMFRQAGMSKQPMGILASSPELMTTAQKAMMNNQPVRAEEGVYNVSKDRLSEYQNKNTQKNLKKQMVNSLSGEGSNKYANLFTIKDNESPLGFGIKKGLNFLNQLPPYLADNIDSAAQYLGRSRDYELTEEQLAKKAASERAGTPVKITDGKYGITKDIPQEYRGSSMDDRYEGLPTDSEMFKSGMERLRANELTEYKAGIGEKLAKIKSGKVTNETKIVADDKKEKKEKTVVNKDKTVVNKDKNNLTINPDVAKKLKIRQDEIEAIAGKRTNLSNETVGSAIKDSAVEALANKNLSEDDKAKTVFEILKGKKSDGKAIKKDIRELLKDMTGTKPGITSTANYNLMMTGLLIASGESPNALTNIARGAAQGLQGYGQALEKERARGLETDLLAGKLAVGEFLEQKKEGRAKSDYVYASDFTDVDGTVYKAGESIKASDEQLIALQKSGVEVADQSTYNNHQKLLTAVAGKKIDNNGIEVTNKQFATDSFYIASSQEALKNNALSVASLDKNILNLAKDGQTIVGGRALIQKIQNSFKAAGDIDILDNADLNQETFDTEVDTALIKYAVALLGEGGKTISDKERAMLYQTMKGFNDSKSKVFQNRKTVIDKIQILRNLIASQGKDREDRISSILIRYENTKTKDGRSIIPLFKRNLGIGDKVQGAGEEKKSTTQNIIKIDPIVINKEPVEEVDIGKYD